MIIHKNPTGSAVSRITPSDPRNPRITQRQAAMRWRFLLQTPIRATRHKGRWAWGRQVARELVESRERERERERRRKMVGWFGGWWQARLRADMGYADTHRVRFDTQATHNLSCPLPLSATHRVGRWRTKINSCGVAVGRLRASVTHALSERRGPDLQKSTERNRGAHCETRRS